jgi:glucose/arabinose dehydrogenase
VVSGRLSRLQAAGNVMTGAEQVLVEDWCQQYPSHSIGTVEFGRDGALYASGGDGASFNFVDYGQDGSPSTRAATRRAALAPPWPRRRPRAAPCAARTCAPPPTR